MPETNPRPEPPTDTGERGAAGEPLQGPSVEAEHTLRRELGALFLAAGPPPSVGATLARAAAGVRTRPRAAPRRWTRAAPIGLAAAAALAAVLLWQPNPRVLEQQRSTEGTATVTLRDFEVADFDRSGRVDVWDAYLVARALESGAESPPVLDLDGDGEVTRADADRIAQRAVEVVR